MRSGFIPAARHDDERKFGPGFADAECACILPCMNSSKRILALLLALPVVTLSFGCGGDDECGSTASCAPPPFDAGPDLGVRVDLGTDAGGDVDAGADTDAGGDVDAGARDAGAMTDGGSLLSPFDAGDPFGDAGTLGTPAWVPLDVLVDGTTCPPLVACGGDELGSWDVTGGCVDFAVPAAFAACPGATITANGRARGRVTFSGGFANRTAQSEISADVFIPAICAGFAGGCPAVEDLIVMSIPGAVCVATPTGDCRCAARIVRVIDDADAYTTMSNQIVSTTSGKRWDYCITAGEMRYRDVSTTGSTEPGIIELGMR